MIVQCQLNRPSSFLAVTAIVLAWLFTISGYVRQLEAAQVEQMELGVIIIGHAGEWTQHVTKEKRIDIKHGLQIDLFQTGDVNRSVQAVLSGSLPLAITSGDAVIRAWDNGATNLVYVGSQINQPVYPLLVQSHIKNYNDLKAAGATIGVSSLNSADAMFVRAMLEAQGFKKGEYSLVQAGGTPDRYAALKRGVINGALIAQPWDLRIQREGYNRLGASTDVPQNILWTAWLTTRRVVKERPDLLAKFLRTVRDSNRWLYDPANRDEAIAILQKYAPSPREDLEEVYDLYIRQVKMFPKDGKVDMRAFQGQADLLYKRGEIKKRPDVRQLVDHSILQKVMKE